jgi:hypothetical protein
MFSVESKGDDCVFVIICNLASSGAAKADFRISCRSQSHAWRYSDFECQAPDFTCFSGSHMRVRNMYLKDNGFLYSLFDYIKETNTKSALKALGKVHTQVLGTWANHQHST